MAPSDPEMLLKRSRTRREPKLTVKKELLSLAGEHRVASELCKRGIFATITPGNRKQTDLYQSTTTQADSVASR